MSPQMSQHKLPEFKDPTKTQAWNKLTDLAKHKRNLVDLFKSDPKRQPRSSIQIDLKDDNNFILFDYSKNLVDREVMDALLMLAREMNVEQWRDVTLTGAHVNVTENRAVLHTALRSREGLEVSKLVQEELSKMRNITEQVHSGKWRGSTGKQIETVVNIGIGGSDLGPAMVTQALWAYKHPRITSHFVSNVDPTDLHRVIQSCDLETTLFVIVSKTFTTAETMANAKKAQCHVHEMLNAMGIDKSLSSKHFLAVSSNLEAVKAFGMDPSSQSVQFWDWVGGRFSVWSAAGLSVMLAIGTENFDRFLEGASVVDKHYATALASTNAPVVMALLGVWYRNFLGLTTHAILPYEQSLARLPAYLQQLEMESNGKGVDRQGKSISYPTCPIIWGEPGTNGQHAFFQLLHQGTHTTSADFILGLQPVSNSNESQHEMLVANCLAQCEALMHGKECSDNARAFSGNRPTSLFVYRKLTPNSLGALIALYEHKVAVQGYLWNINSWDQMGVELGKVLATQIHNEIKAKKVGPHDASTQTALQLYLDAR